MSVWLYQVFHVQYNWGNYPQGPSNIHIHRYNLVRINQDLKRLEIAIKHVISAMLLGFWYSKQIFCGATTHLAGSVISLNFLNFYFVQVVFPDAKSSLPLLSILSDSIRITATDSLHVHVASKARLIFDSSPAQLEFFVLQTSVNDDCWLSSNAQPKNLT